MAHRASCHVITKPLKRRIQAALPLHHIVRKEEWGVWKNTKRRMPVYRNDGVTAPSPGNGLEREEVVAGEAENCDYELAATGCNQCRW